MNLELLTVEYCRDGLRKLEDKAFSFRQNMEARLNTPVLEDGTNLWNLGLNSKTMNVYGGMNEDERHRFKIDHDFDLSMIIGDIDEHIDDPDGPILIDHSISINEETYANSKGTEFIIIDSHDLKGADESYAIRADKYESIREQLNDGDYNVSDLEKAGGFRIRDNLSQEEVLKSDGWKELAVGKNNASEDEYAEASAFLEKYVSEAEKYVEASELLEKHRSETESTLYVHSINPRTAGVMGFHVRTDVKEFRVCHWYLFNSNDWSSAGGGSNYGETDRFLRVHDPSAEGAAQKIKGTPIAEAYETILKDATKSAKEMTPEIVKGVSNIITMYLNMQNK